MIEETCSIDEILRRYPHDTTLIKYSRACAVTFHELRHTMRRCCALLLLLPSSAIMQDYYRPIARPKKSDEAMMGLGMRLLKSWRDYKISAPRVHGPLAASAPNTNGSFTSHAPALFEYRRDKIFKRHAKKHLMRIAAPKVFYYALFGLRRRCTDNIVCGFLT